MSSDISYKVESRKLDRINDATSELDDVEFLTIFIDLKECFQNNDVEHILNILIELSDYLYDENNLTPNITNFFIDNELLPIISTLLVNPLKEEILKYVLKILNQLVHLSINDDLDFHIFLFQNGILKLLIDIRDTIPTDIISTYIHLVALFSFCSVESRNFIIINFPQNLLESLIIEQGGFFISIQNETSFLIWRMTMYPILDDDYISDFIKWFIDFFSRSYLFFDITSLRYWLFALDNVIFEHDEIKPPMLITYGFHDIISFFIKTRNNSFDPKQLENIENENYEEKRKEIFDQDKSQIDELLEIILKIVNLFVESGLEYVSFDIILALLDIANENWKICSKLSIIIIRLLIKKSKDVLLFNDIANIQILLQIYDSAQYSFKYEIVFLLHEIISNAETNFIYQIGPVVIPKLIEYLNDTNDINLIKYVLDTLSTLFWLGVRRNGLEVNEFYRIFLESDGFDFFNNYEEKLEGLNIDQNGFNNLEAIIEEIRDYFPSEEEQLPTDM